MIFSEIKLFPFYLVFIRIFVFLYVFSIIRSYLGLVVSTLLALVLSVFVSAGDFQGYFLGGIVVEGNHHFVLALVSQLLIGFLLAFPLEISCQFVMTSARLADLIRGSQFGEQLNPALDIQVSALENISTIMVGLLLFSFSWFKLGLSTLISSFISLPVDSLQLFQNEKAILDFDFIEKIIQAFCFSILSAVLFVAPLIILILIFEFVGAMLGKLLPKVNIAMELLPFKLIFGLLLAIWLVVEIPNGEPEIFSINYRLQKLILEKLS
jgi:flagellar biosynthesis protein FliR